MKNFIKNELYGWTKAEIFWLLAACGIIAALSVYWGDSLMGIISATTGVACVVCTGKGKLSAYFFGAVNCVLYGLISYRAKLYGETTLNLLYYLPMQFYGFSIWSKNMNAETCEVKKIHMKKSGRIFTLLSIGAGTVGYGFLLKSMGDAMPFVDAFTTASSVIAMIVSIKMYAEQWWIWIGVNVFSVYMWYCDISAGSYNWATLLMWSVYLLNSVIMCVKWEKEVKENGKVSI